MTDNDKDLSNLNEEDLEKVASANGEKLGFLLATSDLPPDVKESLVVLAEKMSGEELDELLTVFETEFLNKSTTAVDEELEKRLRALAESYRLEDEKYEADIKNKLEQIEAAK